MVLMARTDGVPVDVYVLSKHGPSRTKREELDAIGKQVLDTGKAPDDIWAEKAQLTEGTLQFVKPKGQYIAAILVVNRSDKEVKVTLDLSESGP